MEIKHFDNRLKKILVSIDCGLMFLSRCTINDVPQVAMFIKEDRYRINKLGESPKYFSKVAMLKQDDVNIVLAYIQTVGTDMFYESFFNYHCTDGEGIKMCDELINQDSLVLVYFDESIKNRRSIVINNPYKDFFRKAKNVLDNHSWTMEQFDIAKTKIYNKFPNSYDLFQTLK